MRGAGIRRGPRRGQATGPSVKRTDQAAELELPALDDDEDDDAEAVEDDDAAGFESDVEDDEDEDDGVEDFDEAGELLDDEPRLSFR